MSDKSLEHDRPSVAIRTEVGRLDRKVKIGLLVSSCLTILLLLASALGENIFARWRLLRHQYAGILAEKATDDFGRNLSRSFDLEIDQHVVPGMGATDRCITCHTGVDDPRMADQAQPFTTHPGRYLEIHDPSAFGCVICHDGQGRATKVDDTHGQVPFWDHPLLERPFMKSNCGRCHDDVGLYGPARLIDAADAGPGLSDSSELLDRGWRLMEDKGCLGCHVVGGKGGSLGPDLSQVGDKSPHGFDFSHLDQHESRTAVNWHREHFDDPERVAPGTLMPDDDLDEEDVLALTAVMLSLRQDGPGAYRVASRTEPDEETGGQLYAKYCSACHGDFGHGDAIAGIPTPSLANDDVLAVADDDYLRLIIASGRRGTKMPAWGDGKGNLSRDEIERIVDHVRGWEAPAIRPLEVHAGHGDPQVGRVYYQGLCANCHGRYGQGGIGNALNSAEFLAIASDRFLAETIISGRPGTAMPSWKNLPAQGVSDILAYIRLWQAEPPAYADVRGILDSRSRTSLVRTGRQLYGLHCSSCHGQEGEGGIGLRLNSHSLLRAVDDRYLYRAIVEGRQDTAMPAWRHLDAAELAAILSFLRSWQRGGHLDLAMPVSTGDHITGEVYYRDSCRRCHGERGEGGVGPRLAGRQLLDSASDPMLFHWIGHGRAGTAMRGFLPREQGPVSLESEQIADVIAYLRFLDKRGDIPLRRVGDGNPGFGAQIFQGNCGSCHGYDGEGASGPQLNNPTFLRSASDGFLAATMVLGRSGTPMRSMVHGQQGLGQIPPDQVQDVIAFMRLWEGRGGWHRPRLAVEMSERAQATGRELYAGYCSGCHGPNGLGELDGPDHYAPALNNPDFLAAASDGFLLATIARGRRGTPMRPFGKGAGGIVSLESEKISDIVSYLRSWQVGPASKGRTVP